MALGLTQMANISFFGTRAIGLRDRTLVSGGGVHGSSSAVDVVRILHAKTGDFVIEHPTEQQDLNAIAVAPDATQVAAGGSRAMLCLWKTTRQERSSCTQTNASITALVFESDGGLLVGLANGELQHQPSSRGVAIPSPMRAGRAHPTYFENSYALVIGASEYRGSSWGELPSIPGEVESVARALRARGFEVTKVLDPNGHNLRSTIEEFFRTYGYNPENRLLLFFAGHGHTITTETGDKGFIVPVDATDPTQDRAAFQREAVSMMRLNGIAREIEARHTLFVFDSCFAGTIFAARSRAPEEGPIADLIRRPVRQFITAGSADQVVPGQSFFTQKFVEALEGKASSPAFVGYVSDGYLTGTELGLHLHAELTALPINQTPQHGKIFDDKLRGGDFVFELPIAVDSQRPENPGLAETN